MSMTCPGLADTVAPGSRYCCRPVAVSLENGMPRFFRRFAEGVLDEDDIRQRALKLRELRGGAAAAGSCNWQNRGPRFFQRCEYCCRFAGALS